MSESVGSATVVLVHGAWADGSSWAKVIRSLQAKEVRVIAAPLPLTSLSDDIRALERALERTQGPVILAAHAYAGAVIAGTQNERVRGLVYVAALAPAAGETVAEVFYREKPHPRAPQLAPDANGLIWLPDEAFAAAFAQNATPEEIAVLNATQRPIALPCIQERAPQTLWSDKPSWYLVAEEDRMIPHAAQRYMSERMRARVHTEKVDHSPLVSAPDRVVAIIQEALVSVARSP
jgi:pimeloyl-ACP methyl ester carboxylesterase